MCTTSADVPGTGRLCILIDLKYSRAGDGMGFLWLLILFQLLGLSPEAFRSNCLDQYKPWSEILIRKDGAGFLARENVLGMSFEKQTLRNTPALQLCGARVCNSLRLQLGSWAALLDVPSVGCAGTAWSAHKGHFAAWSALLQFAEGGDLVP